MESAIQEGVNENKWGLAKDVATLESLWATTFACVLINLTLKFGEKDKASLHFKIISPSSFEST